MEGICLLSRTDLLEECRSTDGNDQTPICRPCSVTKHVGQTERLAGVQGASA